MRKRCQFNSISRVVSKWRDPGDRFCLVMDWLAEIRLPSSSAKRVSNLEDSNLYQCKRKHGDGHFTATIKVLSSSGVAPFSSDTLEALESMHPFAPPPLRPFPLSLAMKVPSL